MPKGKEKSKMPGLPDIGAPGAPKGPPPPAVKAPPPAPGMLPEMGATPPLPASPPPVPGGEGAPGMGGGGANV